MTINLPRMEISCPSLQLTHLQNQSSFGVPHHKQLLQIIQFETNEKHLCKINLGWPLSAITHFYININKV